MASTSTQHLFLILAILLGFVAIAANARPCKTIIFISTTSSSFPVNGNPNFPIQNPRFLTFYFTENREIDSNQFLSYKTNRFYNDRLSVKPPQLPTDSGSSIGSSVRDRTLDIMSIVGALLFGVGSGALTAAIMYLVWSMFSPRRFDFDGDSDDDLEDFSPKKMGYVAVAADTGVGLPVKQVD